MSWADVPAIRRPTASDINLVGLPTPGSEGLTVRRAIRLIRSEHRVRLKAQEGRVTWNCSSDDEVGGLIALSPGLAQPSLGLGFASE